MVAKKGLICRIPERVDSWIGIDELKKIRVDVIDPVAKRRISRMSLDDLLFKMR